MLEIYNATSALLTFPFRGLQVKKKGTRELVLSPLPYIVVYQIVGEVVSISRVLHGAQKWP